MAEPALLAAVRDGRVDWLRAQDGGRRAALAAALTDPGRLHAVADWRPVAYQRPTDWQPPLDYLRLTAVYRAGPTGTRTWLALWPGLPLAGVEAAPTVGTLARVRSPADARRARHRWRQYKTALGRAVERGRLPAGVAAAFLAAACAAETVEF